MLFPTQPGSYCAQNVAVQLSRLAILFFLIVLAPVLRANPEEATVVCPVCGQAMPAHFHFCGNCGTSLDGVAKPQTMAEAAPKAKAVHKSSWLDMVHVELPVLPHDEAHGQAFSDVAKPLMPIPPRPAPIIEIGESPFLGNGPIEPGFTLPTGATWQPDFIVFGTARSAFQIFDDGRQQITEWANRLDLFGNLYLTPTERILVGITPLQSGTQFAGYRFFPHPNTQGALNGNLETLFFEGDFGQMFPKLDRADRKSIDYGIAVGRQPLSIEDGIMIADDAIDAVSLTRTSLFQLGASALRSTVLFGWNEINRNDNELSNGRAKLIGWFNSADYPFGTIEFDAAYVNETRADSLNIGAGWTRRIFGLINSTFRVNSSFAFDGQSTEASDGTLLLEQLSMTLPDSKDVVYFNSFWGIDNFSSADRGPLADGPLGQVGLLFAAEGLGNYGAPLGNRANSSVGASIGYQKYLGSTAQQILFEIGGRVNTRTPTFFADSQPSEIAGAAQYQLRLSQHCIFVLDSFVGFPEGRSTAYGFRTELLFKF